MKRSNEGIEKNNLFGFNRNIFFTGLTSFLTDTSVKMVYSVMPMFLIINRSFKNQPVAY